MGEKIDRVLALGEEASRAYREGRIQDAIELTEEALRLQGRELADFIVREHLHEVQVPRNPSMALYVGYSAGLNRYKVGITKNITRRTKEINGALRHLAFAPDFEISHYGFCPEPITRASERSLLQGLRHFSAGGEWFRADSEVFWTLFDETQRLREEYPLHLKRFNVEPDLQAVRPAPSLYGVSPQRQIDHMQRLSDLMWEYSKAYGMAVEAYRERVEEMARPWQSSTAPQRLFDQEEEGDQ